MGNFKGQSRKSTPQDVYDRIFKLCVGKANKTTQKEMAEYLGFDPSTINKWKKRFPSVDVLMKISQRFNVSLDWLVYGNNRNGEKVDAVKATYKALTAISEFARVDISIKPMTKENNNGYFYTPYKMNIEITPKIYKRKRTPPGYYPHEWDYYMDSESYKLARFLYNWHGIYKAPISYDNKRNEYDNLLHIACSFHATPKLAGIPEKGLSHFDFPRLCNIPSIDEENEKIISL